MPECRYKGNIKSESFRNRPEGDKLAQQAQHSFQMRYLVSRSVELIIRDAWTARIT